MRYFLLLNENTKEVYLSDDLSEQPDNSIVFFENNFIKAVFDKYPNPDSVIEGAAEIEIHEYNRKLLPKIVSQRQLRTQLVLNGFDLNDIQTAINALSEPNKSIAQIAWDYAITFERDSPLLMCLANNLGLTQSEVDSIFSNASKI